MGVIHHSRKEPMMRLFNAYVRSKMEFCSIVWSPSEQAYINEMEKIQKAFTSRIEGTENMDYHERLREHELYSLERREVLHDIWVATAGRYKRKWSKTERKLEI